MAWCSRTLLALAVKLGCHARGSAVQRTDRRLLFARASLFSQRSRFQGGRQSPPKAGKSGERPEQQHRHRPQRPNDGSTHGAGRSQPSQPTRSGRSQEPSNETSTRPRLPAFQRNAPRQSEKSQHGEQHNTAGKEPPHSRYTNSSHSREATEPRMTAWRCCSAIIRHPEKQVFQKALNSLASAKGGQLLHAYVSTLLTPFQQDNDTVSRQMHPEEKYHTQAMDYDPKQGQFQRYADGVHRKDVIAFLGNHQAVATVAKTLEGANFDDLTAEHSLAVLAKHKRLCDVVSSDADNGLKAQVLTPPTLAIVREQVLGRTQDIHLLFRFLQYHNIAEPESSELIYQLISSGNVRDLTTANILKAGQALMYYQRSLVDCNDLTAARLRKLHNMIAGLLLQHIPARSLHMCSEAELAVLLAVATEFNLRMTAKEIIESYRRHFPSMSMKSRLHAVSCLTKLDIRPDPIPLKHLIMPFTVDSDVIRNIQVQVKVSSYLTHMHVRHDEWLVACIPYIVEHIQTYMSDVRTCDFVHKMLWMFSESGIKVPSSIHSVVCRFFETHGNTIRHEWIANLLRPLCITDQLDAATMPLIRRLIQGLRRGRLISGYERRLTYHVLHSLGHLNSNVPGTVRRTAQLLLSRLPQMSNSRARVSETQNNLDRLIRRFAAEFDLGLVQSGMEIQVATGQIVLVEQNLVVNLDTPSLILFTTNDLLQDLELERSLATEDVEASINAITRPLHDSPGGRDVDTGALPGFDASNMSSDPTGTFEDGQSDLDMDFNNAHSVLRKLAFPGGRVARRGTALFRDRILEECGWNVMSLPFFTANVLHHLPFDEQMRLLEALIMPVLDRPVSGRVGESDRGSMRPSGKNDVDEEPQRLQASGSGSDQYVPPASAGSSSQPEEPDLPLLSYYLHGGYTPSRRSSAPFPSSDSWETATLHSETGDEQPILQEEEDQGDTDTASNDENNEQQEQDEEENEDLFQ